MTQDVGQLLIADNGSQLQWPEVNGLKTAAMEAAPIIIMITGIDSQRLRVCTRLGSGPAESVPTLLSVCQWPGLLSNIINASSSTVRDSETVRHL
jgi:hypothetical protein